MVYNEREETGKESLSNEAFVPDEFTLNRRNLLTMFNMRETRQEKRPLSPGISPQIYINIARSLHLVPDPGSIRRQAPGYWRCRVRDISHKTVGENEYTAPVCAG